MKPTVFDNEQELLKTVLSIHAPNGIELDPMYFKGNFYKEIDKPQYIYDINLQVEECEQGDARQLDLPSSSIGCMVLDPPFMFGIHGKAENYYSSKTHGIFKDFDELKALYHGILIEAYRVLKAKGVLLFKCQDYTDSKTTFTHCHVWTWAKSVGFYPKDLAILHLPKGKVWNSNLQQRHLRKVHSYFWVFIKKRQR